MFHSKLSIYIHKGCILNWAYYIFTKVSCQRQSWVPTKCRHQLIVLAHGMITQKSKYKRNTRKIQIQIQRQIQRLDAIRSTPSIVIYLRAQGSRWWIRERPDVWYLLITGVVPTNQLFMFNPNVIIHVPNWKKLQGVATLCTFSTLSKYWESSLIYSWARRTISAFLVFIWSFVWREY